MDIKLILPILAHLLYDFHWQGEFISQNKGKRLFLLFIHALTWSLLVWCAFSINLKVGLFEFAFLFVTHFLSDYWKSHQPKTDENFYQIYIDQTIHFASILIVYFVSL